MITVRRWYVFLVCAVSLNAVAWAVIALLRNLFAVSGQAPVTSIALQIAVIVVGLPVFLAHWLWAQRLAGRDPDERESALRRLYLYATLAGFIGPVVANAFDLAGWLLWLALGGPRPGDVYSLGYLSPTQGILRNLFALAVLGLLWFYHWRIVRPASATATEPGSRASLRRLYVFGFSAAGVTMTILGIIHLLRWLLYQISGGATIGGPGSGGLGNELARLAVGIPLWLFFWRTAQGMFVEDGIEEERDSALRKFYLYASVFVAVLTAVTNATIILAGLFRRLLDLPSLGDLRQPLPIVAGMAVLWAYHAFILRGDAARAGEAPRQAGIRRLYLYLVAAVGLAALLVGISGDLSVLIRALAGGSFIGALRENLAWFSAALIAGLPVWLLPWRQAQRGAVAATQTGREERQSVVRKIYLYFYLFVATMTVLSSMVYIVYRLLSLLLGASSQGNLLSDLGQAIAFTVIAVGVMLYHGSGLRGDGRLNRSERATRLSQARVVILDAGEGGFGHTLLEGLRRELPGLSLGLIPLFPSQPTPGAESPTPQSDLPGQLAGAGLIVGPWTMAVAVGPSGKVSAEVAKAVFESPARKLLVPVRAEGWEWAGVDGWTVDALVRQTLHAVKQWAEGEPIRAVRPMSAGAIIGIVVGVLILIPLLLSAVQALYYLTQGGF